MKKLIASITVTIYFAFACGVMVNYHYCMDRFDSVRFFKAAGDYCSRCGMNITGKGCCHDVVKIVKLQDDYQTSVVSYSFEKTQTATALTSDFISFDLQKIDPDLNKTDHSPPLFYQGDVYLQNRVLRI